MDPERIEPAQSDTEATPHRLCSHWVRVSARQDDTPKPQTLIPDPLDEVWESRETLLARFASLPHLQRAAHVSDCS